MLSHANVMWNVVQMLAVCAVRAHRRRRWRQRRSPTRALGVTGLPTLFAGGMMVVPVVVEGPTVLDTSDGARIRILFANPDLLELMVHVPEWRDADHSSVRTGVVGGGSRTGRCSAPTWIEGWCCGTNTA